MGEQRIGAGQRGGSALGDQLGGRSIAHPRVYSSKQQQQQSPSAMTCLVLQIQEIVEKGRSGGQRGGRLRLVQSID